MSLRPNYSRTVQLLSEPIVLESLAQLARSLGVAEPDIDGVLRSTHGSASGALIRADGLGLPCFGTDFDEPADTRGLESTQVPPEDPIGFVCWLHRIAARRAVRVARPAWIMAWQGLRPEDSPLAWAPAREASGSTAVDEADGRRADVLAAALRSAREDVVRQMETTETGSVLRSLGRFIGRGIAPPLLAKLAMLAVLVAALLLGRT
jgi:hypothetical protein